MKLAAVVAVGVLSAVPAMAQQVIIQGPNPAAANHDARAAGQAAGDANSARYQARREQGIANQDAAAGNYGAAAGAENAAQRDRHAANDYSKDVHRDAAAAAQADSTTIRVTP
jgi:hypothetical protein